MRTELLHEFLILAEVLNYSEAADLLHTTQSTLSKHIQQLEKELGGTLFVRHAKGVALSADGEIMLPLARQIEDAANTLLPTPHGGDYDSPAGGIDFRYLFELQQTVRLGSIRRAANAVHTPVSSLSRHIKQIEAAIGENLLLIEEGKRVQLLPAGEWFLEGAERLLALEDSCKQRLSEARRFKDRLRIGLCSTVPAGIQQRVLAYCDKHPGAVVNFYLDNPDSLVRHMKNDECDLCLIHCIGPDSYPDTRERSFASGEIVAAVPTSHPLAQTGAASLEQLSALPFYSYPFCTNILHAAGLSGTFHPILACSSTVLPFLLERVAEGKGFTILFDTCPEGPEAVRRISLSPKLDISFKAVWKQQPPHKNIDSILALLFDSSKS